MTNTFKLEVAVTDESGVETLKISATNGFEATVGVAKAPQPLRDLVSALFAKEAEVLTARAETLKRPPVTNAPPA